MLLLLTGLCCCFLLFSALLLVLCSQSGSFRFFDAAGLAAAASPPSTIGLVLRETPFFFVDRLGKGSLVSTGSDWSVVDCEWRVVAAAGCWLLLWWWWLWWAGVGEMRNLTGGILLALIKKFIILTRNKTTKNKETNLLRAVEQRQFLGATNATHPVVVSALTWRWCWRRLGATLFVTLAIFGILAVKIGVFRFVPFLTNEIPFFPLLNRVIVDAVHFLQVWRVSSFMFLKKYNKSYLPPRHWRHRHFSLGASFGRVSSEVLSDLKIKQNFIPVPSSHLRG